jgi:heme/copper-type cytochrome/quinol oxidase subunit 4
MTDRPSATLIFIIFVVIVAIFLAGCVWRMSHVTRDRNPRRD